VKQKTIDISGSLPTKVQFLLSRAKYLSSGERKKYHGVFRHYIQVYIYIYEHGETDRERDRERERERYKEVCLFFQTKKESMIE